MKEHHYLKYKKYKSLYKNLKNGLGGAIPPPPPTRTFRINQMTGENNDIEITSPYTIPRIKQAIRDALQVENFALYLGGQEDPLELDATIADDVTELFMLPALRTIANKDELRTLLRNWKTLDNRDGIILEYGTIRNWDISRNITDMSELFTHDRDFNEDISGWNVINVTNMYRMFLYATRFNQPLNNWNVRNVTNMKQMFLGATSFNQPLDNWYYLQATTNIDDMFDDTDYPHARLAPWLNRLVWERQEMRAVEEAEDTDYDDDDDDDDDDA